MLRNKKLYLILGLTLVMLLTAGATQAGPPGPIEIHGLQTRPDLPVASIILRHPLPDHPLGGPPGQDRQPPPPGGGCDKDIDTTSTISGVTFVAAQNNVICTSADIDTFVDVNTGKFYVVQAGGEEAAWTQTEIGSNGMPVTFYQFKWSGQAGKNTYTPDIKAFRQGNQHYIVMGLERLTVNAFCGVVIVNVTAPASPVIESQFIGADWCDTHNNFVEKVNGEGEFVYATADGPNDMRVLDIKSPGGSVQNPVEVGRYLSPTANNDNYVHDITVIDHGGATGRRAYLAYWDTGLVVLNAADVTPGTNPTPIIGPNQLDPAGFLNHHSFPTQDGNFVFIQDEFLSSNGQQPVQMWNISSPSSPSFVDGVTLGSDVPANPAHNLEVNYGLFPSRLYVGWYKLGLQAWDFTSSGFVRSNPTPRTAVQYHQVQTESADDPYDGAWGVRLATIGSDTYVFQSDRRYGLIVDCTNCPPPPQVVMHVGDLDGSSTPASGGKWNAFVTITVHDASEAPVANAVVSGSWSVGGTSQCTTTGSGQCTVNRNNINKNASSVTFTVTNVVRGSDTYNSVANHDPDGDSNGTLITINKP
ncbi:MAG TPA: hypothetical protein VJ793_17515 [Anaerolineae bacterium]|nr:hypothetical protein [Anaerolineae bacterium]